MACSSSCASSFLRLTAESAAACAQIIRVAALFAALAGNASITSLHISNADIDGESAAALGAALEANGTLQELGLYSILEHFPHTTQGPLPAAVVRGALAKSGSQSLRRLALDNCFVGDEGVRVLQRGPGGTTTAAGQEGGRRQHHHAAPPCFFCLIETTLATDWRGHSQVLTRLLRRSGSRPTASTACR